MYSAAELRRKNHLHSDLLVALLIALMIAVPHSAWAQDKSRWFTVADDVGLIELNDRVLFSPDGRYFVVMSDHGLIDINRAESSLRIYRVEDAVDFISHSGKNRDLTPLWIVTMATCKYGPVVSDVRWLPDSNGLAFLGKAASGNDRLFIADISTRSVEPLTEEKQHVTGFDVRSKARFVYTVLDPAIQENAFRGGDAVAIAGTGQSLRTLLFPEDATEPNVFVHDLSVLWAFVDGNRFRVIDKPSNRSVPIHLEGQRALSLSPDGRTVVTAMTIADVPAEWETLYRPQVPSTPTTVRAGRQDPYAFTGWRDLCEYVVIDLSSGKARSLSEAPLGNEAGWWAGRSRADWSADGKSIVLSNTFLKVKRGSSARVNRPCTVIVDLLTGNGACVEHFEGGADVRTEEMWQPTENARFVHGNRDQVIMEWHHADPPRWTTFIRQTDASWKAEASSRDSDADNHPIEISIRQGLNEVPVLLATEKRTGIAATIWSPNPQIKDVKFGDVSVFKWKDKNSRDWIAGLYKPPDYVSGRRYPLVIQTHGFSEHRFAPSGSYPTTFAAQELAAAGFVVLQVRDCPIRTDVEEGPCQIAGYEAAVEQLARDGLADPDRIGIVGFSRTCYYVLKALTTSSLHFKAASIADGVNEGYWQYLLDMDLDSANSAARDADAVIGTPPFGAGLAKWLLRSPGFNLDKVSAPLEVVATRGVGVLFMWEPYAVLRYLHKPVDLIIVNSHEHVFTNPVDRLISQGSTLDWFRFWLKGYEDPDPAKADQYERWRDLRKLELENELKAQIKEKAN